MDINATPDHTARLTLAALLLTSVIDSRVTAQSASEPDRGRVGITASYAGRGTDLEASVDTPLWKGVRIRGAVASGRWNNQWDDSSVRSPGAPVVTRVTGALVWITEIEDPHRPARQPERSTVRGYLGAGFGIYLPHGDTLRAGRGLHFLAGMEAFGAHWSMGPEISLDAPLGGRWLEQPPPPYFLTSIARVGFVVRRRLR